MAGPLLALARSLFLRAASDGKARHGGLRLVGAGHAQPEGEAEAETEHPLIAIFTTEKAGLLRHLRSVLGNGADAEEVAQEAHLRAWQKRALIRESDPRGFLFRVATNLAIERRRQQSRQPVTISDEALLATAADALTPERVLQARREVDAVQAAIQRLPPAQRRILDLHDAGRTFAEIAVTLDCSQATAWRHLRAAFDAMQAARDGATWSGTGGEGER